MKRCSLVLQALLAASAFQVLAAGAPPAAQSAADPEAAYTLTLEKRAEDILKLLNLTDTNKAAQVHDAIIAHYRWLRSWQEAHEQRLKQLEKTAAGSDKERAAEAQKEIDDIRARLKAPHDQFIAKLSANLTPEQVEKVKDKMTYNKIQVTYDGYCDMLPTLTAGQKAKILEWLKEAREIALDGGSSEEKTAVFNKYKGRINNYLSKEGYDLKKASAEWNARLKAKSAE